MRGLKAPLCGRKAPSGATTAHHVRTQGPLGCYSRTPCADSRPLGAGGKHSMCVLKGPRCGRHAHHMREERGPSGATPAHHVGEGGPRVATIGVLKKSVLISDISMSTGSRPGMFF
ncbi:hypothetical protein V6N13_022360 [Hibiscus sabdariffa]